MALRAADHLGRYWGPSSLILTSAEKTPEPDQYSEANAVCQDVTSRKALVFECEA